jgi:Spy/CpxP family protein refolding chaperone
MNLFDSSLVKRTVLACVPALIAGLPLLSWAQGSTPPPAPSAAPESTITLPTPAAVKDSAAKVAPAPKAATLSDSARAALRSQIDRQLREMADSLKLTPDQRAKARPILLDHGYQIMQLRDKYATQEKTPAVTDAMRKEMQVLRDATDANLALVLTGEQMAQYKKKRDEGLTMARSKMGIAPPAAPAALTPAAPAAPAPADTTRKK